MALFDGGDSNKNAARKGGKEAQKKLKKANKQLKASERKATAALKEAETKGAGALTSAEEKAIPAIQEAVAQGREDLGTGKQEAIDYVGAGTDQAVGKLEQAQNLYQPLAEAAGKGAELYGNFYGLGGQEGFDTAQQQWQASPLYQSMVGEASLGQQALDRQAAARGNPYNATDVLQYQGNLAGRYLNDYTSGLRPYLDQQGQYAGAQANLYNNMANLLYGAGGQQGNFAYGTGGQLANQGMQGGLAQSNVYTGTGQNLSNLYQGIGQTQATGVNVPIGQAQAQNSQTMAQNEAATYANIAAANNASNANKAGMWNSLIGAAGKVGAAYAGA